jgi:hypothetical protein
MAAGDKAFAFTLYNEFGAPIAALMRSELRRMGVEQVSADDLDGLAIDACFALLDAAHAWDPEGGALPWNWARQKLAGIASAFVGQHADSLDAGSGEGARQVADEQLQTLGESEDPEELEVLAGLGLRNGMCALLGEAFALVSSVRDRSLVLEFKVQDALGDPSPANTVAAAHGMRAAAVRQAVKRTLDRLRSLSRAEERFAPLADLALLS